MGGTIGWILAAWPFTFIFVDWNAVNAVHPDGLVNWLSTALSHPLTGDAAKAATKWTFIVAGLASLALADFSLILPHTEPKKTSADGAGEKLAWLEAFKLLKSPFVLVLWVGHADRRVRPQLLFQLDRHLPRTTAKEAGGVGIAANWISPVMSIRSGRGDLHNGGPRPDAECGRLRTTMIVGILGHAARFAVYAYCPQSAAMIIGVQILHGICYAFFFASVYIFVETYFPKDIRSSAQGLFNLHILGLRRAPRQFDLPLSDAERLHARQRHRLPQPLPRAVYAAVVGAIVLALSSSRRPPSPSRPPRIDRDSHR